MATPGEDYQKLINLEIGWLKENSDSWLSPNLTDEEIMALINVVREAFKKEAKSSL